MAQKAITIYLLILFIFLSQVTVCFLFVCFLDKLLTVMKVWHEIYWALFFGQMLMLLFGRIHHPWFCTLKFDTVYPSFRNTFFSFSEKISPVFINKHTCVRRDRIRLNIKVILLKKKKKRYSWNRRKQVADLMEIKVPPVSVTTPSIQSVRVVNGRAICAAKFISGRKKKRKFSFVPHLSKWNPSNGNSHILKTTAYELTWCLYTDCTCFMQWAEWS